MTGQSRTSYLQNASVSHSIRPMRRWILGVATVCVASNVFAQSAPKPALTVRAYRVNQPMRIDGKLDGELQVTGDAIIGNLDDDGYLVASVDEIASMGPWPVDKVEAALTLIQTFDPIGVAARDLQECLSLQLRHLHLEGTPTERIVAEHLRLLQNHQVPEIARKLGRARNSINQKINQSPHFTRGVLPMWVFDKNIQISVDPILGHHCPQAS